MNTLHTTFTYSEILDIVTQLFIDGKIDRKTLNMILEEFKSHTENAAT